MLRITGLKKNTGIKVRRKFFECPVCRTKNWFGEETPYLCQNTYCSESFDSVWGLTNDRLSARVRYYRTGKI